MTCVLQNLSLLLFTIVYFFNSSMFGQTCSAPNCWPGKFYKFDVVAQTGQNTTAGTITGFGSQPSLNDKGEVAFVGQIGGSSGALGEGVFVWNPQTNLTWITPGFLSTTRAFGLAVQINNNKQVVARDRVSGSPPPSLIRIWDGNNPGTFTTIAKAITATDPFSTVYAQPSVNNSGNVVFSASNQSFIDLLATPNSALNPPFNELPMSVPLRPMIADTGQVVVRRGNTTTSPIILFANNLSTSTQITIADTTEFNSLGQSPGISGDGVVVAFAGDMNSAGASHWNTNTGPGIFAAIIQSGSVSSIIRIAGFSTPTSLTNGGLGSKLIEDPSSTAPPFNSNGWCDSVEQSAGQCIPAGELEDLPGTTPTHVYFSTFDPANFASSTEWQNRIAVTHTATGNAGLDGDSIVVSFIATPNLASGLNLFTANQGLWTVRTDLLVQSGTLVSHVYRPIPVIQVGAKIASATTVTGISVFDQLSNAMVDDSGLTRTPSPGDHRVAFWVSTSTSGQMILRGEHLDSDGDGLLDHWETFGIDFDGDGVLDLNLQTVDPAKAANPMHKDLFVEIDYMCTGTVTGGTCSVGTGQHTHQPNKKPNGQALAVSTLPLAAITAAFAKAPVTNPDSTNGVNLHALTDEAIAEINPMVFGGTGSTSFNYLKNGTSSCGTGASSGHFGTQADRLSANCQQIINAKRLLFRYTIFAHQWSTLSAPSTPLPYSGVAKIGGADFTVTLSAGANSLPPCPGVDFADKASCTAQSWGSPTTFDTEWSDMQGGTFMHELGHTLGLLHGGSDPWTNYKPNYLSVMNYGFQFNNSGNVTITLGTPADCKATSASSGSIQCRTNRAYDYSAGPALNNLNETSLSEPAGIGNTNGSFLRMVWTVPVGSKVSRMIGPASGGIDWDASGSASSTVALDVNNDGNLGLLVGNDDWSSLRYSFLTASTFNAGVDYGVQSAPELNTSDYANQTLGNPAPEKLSVTLMGAGTGSVTSSPSGISCGSTCGAYFYSGTVVTLTANPGSGSSFAGWGGACTGTGTCSITLSAATSVTATFNSGTSSFTLSVTKAGTGSGTVTSNPSGISCGSACSASFSSGTVVGLTVTPGGGSIFAGWTGACTGTAGCSVTMNSNQSVTATFNSSAGAPAVSLSPTSLTFAGTLLNITTVAKTVTLTNSGSAALSITSVLASGDFAQTNNCPSGSSTLAAGANCAVNVTFTPSVPGKILGEITIADNASGTPHLVNLSGTGLATISVSPASLSFGTVTVGTTTAGKVFTLTNNSSGSLTLSLTSSAGYNVAGSGTSPCGSSLAAKAKCTATVTFAPRTNGAINGAVSVSYGSIFSPQQVTLTGTGSGGATSPLTFKPASLSFAAQLIGTTSPSKTVTVTNSSTGSVIVSSLSAIGNYSVASTGTTPCAGAVLAAGGTCTFAITFNPTYPGTVKGGIAIANSTAVSPEVFNVSGSAALPLGFSPTSLTFPAQTVGTTSAGKTVTLSNNQSTSATISLVATGQFAVSGSGSSPCAASLAAHSKCTFAVTFSPSVVGTVKGVVTLNYGSSFSPVELNLSGTGQ